MSSSFSTIPFRVNGRNYCPPDAPVAVICLDGSADEYIDEALSRDLMPRLKQMTQEGYRGMARGALPSFTNVNNSSIVTGVPPTRHGISGNFFLDPDSGKSVMMNSADYLRCETILSAAEGSGRRTAVVTAKEKLRDILSAGRKEGIAISAEKADEARHATHGVEQVEGLVGQSTPEIYSADASLFVLQAGCRLIGGAFADFVYLSLTDFIQHKYAPTDSPALQFYHAIDRYLGELLDLGAVVGATADHGMNAKQQADQSPNVVYLESKLDEEFGAGFQVILPITDPYVLHHGALGSFALIHAPDSAPLEAVANWVDRLPGITEVYDRETAARKLELPIDRIGDLAVLSARDVVIGKTPEDHDLSHVASGLRSHGGRYEEMVPFIVSRPLNPEYRLRANADVRNFDIFAFVTNGVQP